MVHQQTPPLLIQRSKTLWSSLSLVRSSHLRHSHQILHSKDSHRLTCQKQKFEDFFWQLGAIREDRSAEMHVGWMLEQVQQHPPIWCKKPTWREKGNWPKGSPRTPTFHGHFKASREPFVARPHSYENMECLVVTIFNWVLDSYVYCSRWFCQKLRLLRHLLNLLHPSCMREAQHPNPIQYDMHAQIVVLYDSEAVPFPRSNTSLACWLRQSPDFSEMIHLY